MPKTLTYEQAKAIYIACMISNNPTPPSKEVLDILDKYENENKNK